LRDGREQLHNLAPHCLDRLAIHLRLSWLFIHCCSVQSYFNNGLRIDQKNVEELPGRPEKTFIVQQLLPPNTTTEVAYITVVDLKNTKITRPYGAQLNGHAY